ncbi:MAG: ABC transporter permease [Spirochaetes bacterium]|nr:ABC transporter permease [Spirochaetota bacterium]
MNNIIYNFGRKFINFSMHFLDLIKVFPYTISALYHDFNTKGKSFNEIFIKEVYNSGIIAVPMVLILGFISGILSIVLFPFETISFGIKNIYGNLYSTLILRELAPSLTTFVVMIRSTISITIELTQMKIDGEVETLELLGINPIQYLGSIKIAAGLLILPVLTLYLAFSALFGGMLSAFFVNNVPIYDYLQQIFNSINLSDIVILVFKTLINGVLIFLIAIYIGLNSKKSSNIVISSTIKAITISIFVVLIINIIITVGIYAAK